MEGDSTTETLRDYKKNLDSICAGVMPDSWEGHGRLAVRESESLSGEKEAQAIQKLAEVSEKKPHLFEKYGAEKVANKVIERLA
jgi:hypothetical protein